MIGVGKIRRRKRTAPGTVRPIRNFRLEDSLWLRLEEIARMRGIAAAAVIGDAIERYIADYDAAVALVEKEWAAAEREQRKKDREERHYTRSTLHTAPDESEVIL